MRGHWAGFGAALLGSALMVVGLAAGAWAQNGLERFEKEVKPQLELKSFTYKTGTAVGTSGFVLTDVVAVVPANAATGDKESTIKIERVAVDALDFDRLKKDAKDDEAPRFAKLKLEGMTGDDEMFTALAPYGVPKVPVDIALDYAIDGKDKVLTLKTLEINLRGQAKFTVALVVDGISDKSSAMDDGKLRTASLTIDDSGLIAKVLPAVAKEEGMKPEEVIDTALGALAGFAAMQGAPTLKALDAVASFVADWKAPKGPLALGLKPTETAGLEDLDKVMKPNALVDLFGFTATYPGTKPGAAKAGPAK
ncbi:MAG: hypothetical protein HYZ40_14690 [Rhodospirillales bacterium]|nr:hypothetical protein [Rhodospirillales bacterium]